MQLFIPIPQKQTPLHMLGTWIAAYPLWLPLGDHHRKARRSKEMPGGEQEHSRDAKLPNTRKLALVHPSQTETASLMHS